MAEMDVGRGRVEALLDPEGAVFLYGTENLVFELILGENIDGSPYNYLPLVFEFFSDFRAVTAHVILTPS
jgi:hypothetical protein